MFPSLMNLMELQVIDGECQFGDGGLGALGPFPRTAVFRE